MTRIRQHAFALLGFLLAAGLFAAWPDRALAHCDGMDGPVVKAAMEALAKGDVNLVLIWVRAADEPEIREAFDRTLRVRTLSPEAQDLADTYFFETLVRIHRMGEGAPYTGLKPAGRDLGPAIPAADRALESGDVRPLADLLVEALHHGLQNRFEHVMAAKGFDSADVTAGRAYVEAYVVFLHYVEGLYETAVRDVSGHFPEDSPDSHVHE